MQLSSLEIMKLSHLTNRLGSMTLDEIAILYNETTLVYLSLRLGDIASERLYTEMKQLQEYGNLLTRTHCKDENALVYEVDVRTTRNYRDEFIQADKEKLIKEIGDISNAQVIQPIAGKRLFSELIFIVPIVTLHGGGTDHVLIKQFLDEYKLKYRRVAPRFSYDIG